LAQASRGSKCSAHHYRTSQIQIHHFITIQIQHQNFTGPIMMRPTLLLLLVCPSESLHVQKTGETSGRGCIFGMCVWSDPHNTAQTTPKTDKEIYTDLAMQIDAERKQAETDTTPNCFLGHWCEDTQAIKVRHEKKIQELEMSQKALAEQYGASKMYEDDKEKRVFEDTAAKNGAESERNLEASVKAAREKENRLEEEDKKNRFASDKFGDHSARQAKDIEIMRGKDAPERVKSEHVEHAARDDLERQEWQKMETNPDNWNFLYTFLHAATSRWNNLFSQPPAERNSIGHSTPAPLLSKKEVLASPTRPTDKDHDHDHGHDRDAQDGLTGF